MSNLKKKAGKKTASAKGKVPATGKAVTATPKVKLSDVYMDPILVEEGLYASKKDYVRQMGKTFKDLSAQAENDPTLKKILK